MFNIFFHPLKWDNDMYIVYIVWALLIPITLFAIRFAYKSFCPITLKYKGVKVTLVRDLFLRTTGIAYLIPAVILYSVYIGFWAYYTSPTTANWANWQTYMIIIPQIILLIVVITLFAYRYMKFRKPFIR